jgi:hypothetical protein
MPDERGREEERKDDEIFFLGVWRAWRQGRSHEECEAMVAKLLTDYRSPICAEMARRDLDREDRNPLAPLFPGLVRDS